MYTSCILGVALFWLLNLYCSFAYQYIYIYIYMGKEQMLPLSKARRINRSHSSPLRQSKDSLGVALLSFWGAVGAASHS